MLHCKPSLLHMLIHPLHGDLFMSKHKKDASPCGNIVISGILTQLNLLPHSLIPKLQANLILLGQHS